jgi:hypothetical protein
LAYFMNLNDVGVVQLGDGIRLNTEAGEMFDPGVIAVQDHLQGDDPIRTCLPGLVQDTHATASQFAQDLEAGESRPTQDIGP